MRPSGFFLIFIFNATALFILSRFWQEILFPFEFPQHCWLLGGVQFAATNSTQERLAFPSIREGDGIEGKHGGLRLCVEVEGRGACDFGVRGRSKIKIGSDEKGRR